MGALNPSANAFVAKRSGAPLLAVPADGGHHFFDVAAGAAVAAFAVLAARALLQGEDDRQAAIFVAPVGQAG
jgi:hypothetical protein